MAAMNPARKTFGLMACLSMCAFGAVGIKPGFAQSKTPLLLTEQTTQRLLKEIDQSYDPLVLVIKRWDAEASPFTDFRQRTVRDDIRDHVLTKATQASIEAARKEAKRQSRDEDWPGAIIYAQRALTETAELATRMRAVLEYWLFAESFVRYKEQWRSAIEAHGLADPHLAAREELERALEKRIAAQDFIMASQDELPALREHFLRSVQQARAEQRVDVLQHDPLRRVPRTPCATDGPDDQAPAGERTDHPVSLDKSKKRDYGKYFPKAAVMGGRIGLAAVRARVTASGCARWVELVASSGHLALDEASLDFAANGMTYLPAIVGGIPREDEFVYRVNFEIADATPIIPVDKAR
ncbi:MAG: energy transducer TonB [Steroidobacteraceae bacterium]